jgi:methenyltetrahydrofolate cyclohydrolase (EC 3.5.4.9)/5,10-methylenetetrahydrofolate dehydrogenase (NADP+) (EC 1.5.1.5)
VTTVIDGTEVAEGIRTDLAGAIETLADRGTRPGLATVLMSPDPASETYVSMKQRACEDVGIEGVHVGVDTDAPASELYDTIADLNDDPDVHGILVQLPLPEHVPRYEALERIDPQKDVDALHPENVGRLTAGRPRFKPCTPHGVQRLLNVAGVETEGADVTIVGRSAIVGKPLANMLTSKTAGGNATVTVCHSRTRDLKAKARGADVLVAAAGRAEMIGPDMVSEDATVVDVGVNRVDADTQKGYELVGDVDFEAVKPKVDAITPVPGGVGPMTIAMLLYNATAAAALQQDVDVDLP